MRVWSRPSYLERSHYEFGARQRRGEVILQIERWYDVREEVPQAWKKAKAVFMSFVPGEWESWGTQENKGRYGLSVGSAS